MRDKKCFSEALAEAQRPAEAKPRQRLRPKKNALFIKPFFSQVVLFSSGADTFSIALKASPTKAI